MPSLAENFGSSCCAEHVLPWKVDFTGCSFNLLKWMKEVYTHQATM